MNEQSQPEPQNQTATVNNELLTVTPIACKNCGLSTIAKFGTYKGIQLYYCKACKHKFKGDSNLFHMKTSTEQIGSAMEMYYSGISVKDIRALLKQKYGNKPSKRTIYKWIYKYLNSTVKIANEYHPKVGDTWIANETILRVAGQNVWMYDIIDEKTRFLLAASFALSRISHNAEMLLREASYRAMKKIPKVIIADPKGSFPAGIEKAFGSETERIQIRSFSEQDNMQKMERRHDILKERIETMKGLKNIDSAIAFIDGFLVYYNYFRPNKILSGKTPAGSAEIEFPCKNWTDILRQPVPK